MSTRQHNSQAGLTLVELMISMVILSVVIAGALNMGYSIMNGYRYMRTSSALEVKARAATNIIADAVKLTSPGLATGTVFDLSAAAAANCDDFTDAGKYGGTVGIGTILIKNNSTAPDELIAIHASGGILTSLQTDFAIGTNSIGVNDASAFSPNDFVLVVARDYVDGVLLRVASTDLTTTPHTITTTTTPNAACGAAVAVPDATRLLEYVVTDPTVGLPLVLRVRKSRFFIDSSGGMDLLMLDPDSLGADAAEPIADGIEDLQITVAVDGLTDGTNIDGIATDDLRNAPVLANNEIVRGLQIDVVARTTNVLNDSNNVSNRPGLGDRADGTTDGFLRRTISTRVEIRNLTGSPGTL